MNYQDWPIIVKITTALSVKNFHIKKGSSYALIGYVFCFLGILLFGSDILSQNTTGLFKEDLIAGIGCFLIGIQMVVTGYSVDWISKNSSWEERFRHSSQLLDKLGAGLMLCIGLMGLFFIIV